MAPQPQTAPKMVTEARELTLENLRRVKMEGMMIDALALIGLATTATTLGAKKAVLADCAIKCPRIYDHMAHCHFGRKSASPALSTEGAYLLLVTLAGGHISPKVENSCYAIGTLILTCKRAPADLFRNVCSDLDTTSEAGTEAGDCDAAHDATLRAEARDTALMNKLHASTKTLLLAVQLQKELNNGEVASSLQSAAKGAIQQIEQTASTQGTHDALDLLIMFNHSASEAAAMAPTFGKFLKAARVPANYTPNTHEVQFGASPSSCNSVALYNPKLHADIIMPAYESFKQSPVYARYIDVHAEKQRRSRITHMQVMDIAKTHSRPRAALMVKDAHP